MIGSSSIRMWATADAFPGKPVINRGFGGSELSDVLHYYEQIVAPYAPARVFLYAGDNDIGNGKTAQQVLADYEEFSARLRLDFPDTELVFISIKPSRYRWELWPVMADANQLIAAYSATHANRRYADLATPLLDDAGEPGDVFIADGLHLNETGYALWREALAPYLESAGEARSGR
ncbi:MAG: hypothetical protein KJP03_05545 [Gammaproteobacteria bacterium]|nr:hypothetical protein [Gammaproteobacteria bacterium]